MITNRPRLLAAGAVVVATAALGAGASSALAIAADPPSPSAPPSAAPVDPKYADPTKLQDVVLGPMAVEPVTGDLKTVITFTTSGGCPWGSNTVTRIFGPKLPEVGQNVIGNNWTYDFGSPPADRMTVPMTIDLAEVIARQPDPVVLDGTYRILMQCQLPEPEALLDNFGVFEAVLKISDSKYTALTTRKDLPSSSTPKTGSDAFAALEASKNMPAPPAPLIDQQRTPPGADETELTAAATDDRPRTYEMMALAVGGGIIAAGMVPLMWNNRRKSASAGRR